MPYSEWNNLKSVLQGDVSVDFSRSFVSHTYIDFDLIAFSSNWEHFDIAFEYRLDKRERWNTGAVISRTSSEALKGNILYGISASSDGTLNQFRWEYAKNNIRYSSHIQVRIRFLPRVRTYSQGVNNYAVSENYADSSLKFEGFSEHNVIGKDKNGNYMCLGGTSLYIISALDTDQFISSSESSESTAGFSSSSSSSFFEGIGFMQIEWDFIVS